MGLEKGESSGISGVSRKKQRIYIIANRATETIVTDKSGNIVFNPDSSVQSKSSSGGLATANASLAGNFPDLELVSLGWPGVTDISTKLEERIRLDLIDRGVESVFFNSALFDGFYNGACNGRLWIDFHEDEGGSIEQAIYNPDHWKLYRKANEYYVNAFLGALKRNKESKGEPLVWVHDYQLMLMPEMLRKKAPDAKVGFFLHIPFPPADIFWSKPDAAEILRGLLGSGMIGFHTPEYRDNFVSAVRRLGEKDADIVVQGNTISVKGRRVKVEVHPIGIDYNKYATTYSKDYFKILEQRKGSRKEILSVQRLDPSKGIIEQLLTFEALLEQHSELKDNVFLRMIVVPSREKVGVYKSLSEEAKKLVARINKNFPGTLDYQYQGFPLGQVCAAYRNADVAWVVPKKDGMNLVAKEFVAAHDQDKQGVLIVGQDAGAAKQLGPNGALLVDPRVFDKKGRIIQKKLDAMVCILHQALTMSPEEQARRMQKLQQNVKEEDIVSWASKFVKSLGSVATSAKQTVNRLTAQTAAGVFSSKVVPRPRSKSHKLHEGSQSEKRSRSFSCPNFSSLFSRNRRCSKEDAKQLSHQSVELTSST